MATEMYAPCLQIVLGWVLTLFVAGFVSGLFTAFGAYSPSKLMGDQVLSAAKVSSLTKP